MPPEPPPSYESEMPASWHLFTSRVDANQPTPQEREAAHELIRTGWFSRHASTYDRKTARDQFESGMRYGFKDHTYQVNWQVWRSEYKGRNYPPGSFDPAPTPDQPNDPQLQAYADDPNRPGWMSPERWRDEQIRQQQRDQRELRRQMKQNRGNVGEPMRPEDHPNYVPPEKVIRPKLGFPWIKRVEKKQPRETEAEKYMRYERRKEYFRRLREQRPPEDTE